MKSLFKKIVVTILTWEARLALKKYKPKIVAVTGSVGKTSTKDAIYTLLASTTHARKSEKSFNSELGVPLTILGLPNAWGSLFGWLENIVEGLHVVLAREVYPQWLVLEVGADRPGDIKNLAWLKPHIVVFTRFPDVPVHVEFFGSKEAVIAEKRELKHALREGGTLIINADDPEMAGESVREGQRLLRYGVGAGANVTATDYAVAYEMGMPIGISCSMHFQNSTAPLTLRGTLGTHHLYPLLAALTVGVSEGMAFSHCIELLATHTPPPGRMRVLRGARGSVIIDDTYNSSPIAVEAGLATIASLTVSGRKIVVLGDMMELGDFSVAAHREVGERVSSIADLFVTVGVRMLAAGEAAQVTQGKCSHVESLNTSTEAGQYLAQEIKEGDVAYVKGSQSTRMERAVEAILSDPASAPTVLVRQDKEWKEKA